MVREAQWRQLRETAGLGSGQLAGGGRLRLRPEAAAEAEDLIRQESDCCGFLDFELASDGEWLRLDITSPVPEGEDVARLLLGLTPAGPEGR
jgi:hypothetical protein